MGGSDSWIDATRLARFFHKTYEEKAPDFGYKTREETREFDPDSKNGKLMVAVCREVIKEIEKTDVTCG